MLRQKYDKFLILIIMAKLGSASIRLVQKMNRMNKDGEYPIYLVVCWRGRVEKSVGVSCLPRYWDAKREEVKRSCPNSLVFNKMLNDIKNRCIERRNGFEYNGKAYTAKMLLDDVVIDFTGKSNVYKDLMYRLINERRLKHKTVIKYEYSFRKLCEYIGNDDFIVNELNVSFLKDFMNSLNVSDGTKRDICSVIASVWNYAISSKCVDASDYPFVEFRFQRKYRSGVRNYCIDVENMQKLKEYFLDMVCIRDGNSWSYRDGAFDRLHKRSSKEFGICWFLAEYYLNGSAPIDVALLKVSNCSREDIDGVDYWRLEFKRKKTNTSVSVRLKRNMFSIIILEHFLGYSRNGYVYPVISDGAVSDKQIQNCVNNASNSAIKWVRKAFEAINESTIMYNANSVKRKVLVDIEKVDMYTARHSFASNYLNSEGATIRGAASLLARSPNSIATYIHSLTHSKDIADAVSFLDD